MDPSREFIDSAGAKHYAEAKIGEVENRNPFLREVAGETLAERFANNLKDNNVSLAAGAGSRCSDSTIGRSTVLMPFGGRTQRSETQVFGAEAPRPTDIPTRVSVTAFGYNPYLASWSPLSRGGLCRRGGRREGRGPPVRGMTGCATPTRSISSA